MFGDERKVNVKLLLAGLYLKQNVGRTQLSPDINTSAKKTWHTRLATDGHGGHAGMCNRMLPLGRRPRGMEATNVADHCMHTPTGARQFSRVRRPTGIRGGWGQAELNWSSHAATCRPEPLRSLVAGCCQTTPGNKILPACHCRTALWQNGEQNQSNCSSVEGET